MIGSLEHVPLLVENKKYFSPHFVADASFTIFVEAKDMN